MVQYWVHSPWTATIGPLIFFWHHTFSFICITYRVFIYKQKQRKINLSSNRIWSSGSRRSAMSRAWSVPGLYHKGAKVDFIPEIVSTCTLLRIHSPSQDRYHQLLTKCNSYIFLFNNVDKSCRISGANCIKFRRILLNIIRWKNIVIKLKIASSRRMRLDKTQN